jgi:hypothetical protein
MMRLLSLLVALGLLAVLPAPLAAAPWLEATSERYIVTAALEEDELREVVEMMEDFDRLLELHLPPQTRPSRKMRIFLEKDVGNIARVAPISVTGWSMVHPELLGSYSGFDPGAPTFERFHSVFHAQSALFIGNGFIRPSAWWVRQGVSSYLATASRDEEGRFIIGAPDLRRPLRERITRSDLARLFELEQAPRIQSEFVDYSIFAREAATALLLNTENKGLMEAYLDAFAGGASMEEAAGAIGDLESLARQINQRASSPRKSLLQFPLPERPTIAISFRQLGEDEVALVAPRFLRLGDEKRKQAARTLGRLTRDHPDSALTWYEYAAAEYALVQEADFGGEPVFRGFGFSNGQIIVSASRYSDTKAWDAVNRALELDPGLAPAITLKAEILMARLVRAGDGDMAEGFAELRRMLAPLAREPELEPLAAAVLFQSYIEEGVDPPDTARDGLARAFVTNPAVGEFRYAYAVALARQGQRAAAEKLLISMLNDPRYKEAARRALEATP